MKSMRYIAIIASLAFVFSMSAFAKDSNSGSFNLGDPANIGSTHLDPGHYKAEWNGPANNLKVTILHNGKQVATVDGHMKDLSQPSPYDEVILKNQSDNSKTVDEIQFNHRTQALDLAD